jgi:formamidopyrimidine-DNA glycosylase
MPELPEVEIVRRELAPVMIGTRINRLEVRRPDLRAPFPKRFAARIEGRRVVRLDRRAKYLLAELSSGETLLMHLGMSGSFRVERNAGPRPGENAPARTSDRHDHVVFHLASGTSVIFNDPRRFGVMDLLAADALSSHPTLGALGPEPLSPDFDGAALARACARRKTSLKVALLDQRVVAGLGNIYVSEALHIAGLSPERLALTIATPAGVPRPAAHRLASAIKQVLDEAIARASGTRYRSSRFLVYDREGARCRRRGCRGAVRRKTQAGRSTFYCAVCQR